MNRYLNRELRTAALHETALPVPYDAKAMPGSQVTGADGMVYWSLKRTPSGSYEWVSLVEAAENATYAVLAALSNAIVITVNRNAAQVEGVNYHTLRAAIAYASRRFPITGEADDQQGLRRVEIRILEAHGAMREQVYAQAVNLDHVLISSETATVTVEAAFLTGFSGTRGDYHAFFNLDRGATCPLFFGVVFVSDGETPPQDPARVASSGAYTPKSIGLSVDTAMTRLRFRDRSFTNDPITPRLAGFRSFTVNLDASSNCLGGQMVGADLSDATEEGGALRAGTWIFNRSRVSGCTTRSLRLAAGAHVLLSDVGAGDGAFITGVYTQDFRRDPAADSASDISISGGSILHMSSADVRGGNNIGARGSNHVSRLGNVIEGTGPLLLQGAPVPPSRAVADLPAASSVPGAIYRVSNGDDGAPCLALSEGGAWLRIPLGAAVSAT